MVLVNCRSQPAPTPMAGIDRPRLFLSYVANVCFRCFSRFKGMLQLFLMDVAKVDRGCCTCCKCFRGMLQAFVQNVSSVPDIRCKRFDLGVCICFTHVATCSISFICFRRMLQVFYLDVAYVTMTMLQV